MERRLYIPDTNRWLEYFDRSNGRGNRTGLTIIGTGQWGGGVANFHRMQTTHVVPLSACATVSKDKLYAKGRNNKKKNYENATKVEITSQTRDVLERAEADVKRKRKLNNEATHGLVIRSKKSRRESKSKGEISKKLKFEKVRASDIFS